MTKSTSILNINYTSSSPIFKLTDDIVLHVFFLNADMDQDYEENIPALRTLRHTSQVCAYWRALATGFPVLWARVLNLRFLADKRGKWRHEVIRRTGTVPLYIKGHHSPRKSWVIDRFHRWVVDENWERVRYLDLQLDKGMLVRLREARRWSSILQRPASSLTIFRFWWPRLFEGPSFTMFSNDAPSLQTFSVDDLKLNLVALSMPNIRYLHIRSQISVSDFLSALSKMPLLEKLKAWPAQRIIVGGNPNKLLPRVTVPRLTEISLSESNGTDASLSLLAHIIPANGCTISFSSSYIDQVPNNVSMELAREVLSTYSAHCTELERATQVKFIVYKNSLDFLVHLPAKRRFSFAMNSRFTDIFPEQTISALVLSVKSPRLDTITGLMLYFRDPDPLPLLSNPDIIKFVTALVSVKVLTTNVATIHALSIIQSKENVVVLPSLKTIDLDTISAQSQVSLLRNFLNPRIKLGIPIGAITLKVPARDAQSDCLKDVRDLVLEFRSANDPDGREFHRYGPC